MRIVNQSAVPSEHRLSPKGSFEVFRKHISIALGAAKDVGPWAGGHAFDVELARVPAGKKNYPYHSHAAQTEYYIVLAGSGRVTDGSGNATSIQPGDHFVFLPGEAHQIENDADTDLEYLVIADHHRADITSYPATGKRLFKPEMRCVKTLDTDYYEDEE
jgi:uncharacterized cupin superfamily protein